LLSKLRLCCIVLQIIKNLLLDNVFMLPLDIFDNICYILTINDLGTT
jgi:hypothetical protein